ncbi:geranylgeranylglycerol-phosphate geranylgeranyltransferase [candidate division KSB1 bacterium]|nr:geranylgeranylglycerol-phosphate geranylgeranyltransferase [candidate division KSB1 bacterium]
MTKLLAYLAVIRPINVVIGFLSIFMGAFITGTIQPIEKVLLACLSGALIQGAANAINDYFDLEIDLINKPHRPLPAGKVSRQEIFAFSMVLFMAGIICGGFVNTGALVIAALSSALLYLYSARLKASVLYGNLAVSLVTGMAFIYGGVAVDRFQQALIPAGFSFLFHFGREIIKDIQDVEGDEANRIVTFAIRFGKRISMQLTTAIYTVLIIATFLPYFYGIYGPAYFLVVVIGVDLVILACLISMWRAPVPAHLGKISTILKADMLVGLLAIYLGT